MNAPRRCNPSEVVSLYTKGLTQGQISDLVGVGQTSVGKILRKNGIHASENPRTMRRYTLNESFFSEVTIPDQAYWLGFLAADGYVLSEDRGIGLSLAVKDAGHLEQFRSAVGSNAPLVYTPPSGKGGDGLYRVRLYSTQMARDAARHGIIPQKSQYCAPWDAPPDLAHHYWRGLIDGDGYIHERGRHIIFVGTLAMCEAFKAFAASICGTRVAPKKLGNYWNVNVCGRRQVHALLSALYSEDSTGLARKKERALSLTAEPFPVRTSPPCRIDGCPGASIAKKLCKKHYQRWKKTGDPLGVLLDRGPDGRFRALTA